MHREVIGGNLFAVRSLIEQGSDVNEVDKFGMTPLMYAARGQTEIVRLLLERGADLNPINKDGDQAVHIAIREGRTLIAQTLIEQGAQLHHTNKTEHTPLLLALLYSRPQLVPPLLDHRASLDLAFVYAASQGLDSTLLSFIARGVDVNCRSRQGDTAVMLASKAGHLSTVRLLVAEGADLSCANKLGSTAALFAAEHDRLDVMAELLAAGAPLDGVNRKDGRTALHYATKEGNWTLAEELLNHGADANIIDKIGLTPLLYATSRNQLDVVEMLIGKGALMETANRDGDTPLVLAARKGYEKLVELLVSKGANVNASNRKGFTALMYYAERGSEAMQCLLTSNIDAANVEGDTALILAVRAMRVSAVRTLIKHMANVNKVNNKRFSPIAVAAARGHSVIAEILVLAGADLNIPTFEGNTAIVYAFGEHRHLGLVRYLAYHGARPDNCRLYLDRLDRVPVTLAYEKYSNWARRKNILCLLYGTQLRRALWERLKEHVSWEPPAPERGYVEIEWKSWRSADRVFANFDLSTMILQFM